MLQFESGIVEKKIRLPIAVNVFCNEILHFSVTSS